MKKPQSNQMVIEPKQGISQQETRARGAPTLLTPAVAKAITDRMKTGLSVYMAGAEQGIPKGTIRSWFHQARNGHELFFAFFEQVQIAQEIGKIQLIESLKLGGHEDPASLRFLLERMFPDEFGAKLHVTNQVESELEGFLDVARRVLERKVFEALLEAIVAAAGSQEIAGASG